MPTFDFPSSSSSVSGDLRPGSQQSSNSYKSAVQIEFNQIEMPKEVDMEYNLMTRQVCSENSFFEKILLFMQNSMSAQALQHQTQMEHMQAEVRELKELMRQTTQTPGNFQPSKDLPKQNLVKIMTVEVDRQSLKLKPIKWPEAYDHKDQTQWSTTCGVLHYIYERDVVQRNFLEPLDFFHKFVQSRSYRYC
ncbi:hypothetical protein GcM1_098001 [Golovinomyces cichoracearum]|uniref:Uncharacterized protein n=1 Tax=Golovinomyces cichoracearum TaxID=62708 RepID=A0A420JC50_9PEZI|nr:hypothetical protein GcM1_098001 [Golovinomyces cichoracearum]